MSVTTAFRLSGETQAAVVSTENAERMERRSGWKSSTRTDVDPSRRGGSLSRVRESTTSYLPVGEVSWVRKENCSNPARVSESVDFCTSSPRGSWTLNSRGRPARFFAQSPALTMMPTFTSSPGR